MTKNALEGLKIINEKILFTPVTTRTLEQYTRMPFFFEMLSPKYAVVANGGIILTHGMVDKDWEYIISSKMKEYEAPADMIDKCGFFIKHSFVKSVRLCQELFIAVTVDEGNMDMGYFEDLVFTAGEYGYTISKQGRKVYIIPECINKWSPLQYICEKEMRSFILTAGDSSLDYPMLERADYAVVPDHGEVKSMIARGDFTDGKIYITKNRGVLAGEEIIDTVLQRIA